MHLITNLDIITEHFLQQRTTNGTKFYSRNVVLIGCADTYHHIVEVEVIVCSKVLESEVRVLLKFFLMTALAIETWITIATCYTIINKLGFIDNSTITYMIVRLIAHFTISLLLSILVRIALWEVTLIISYYKLLEIVRYETLIF